MSHRWQRRLPRRRSQHRRQPPIPSGLCLGPHLQRHPGKRAGWLPSFLCVADKRVCRNVHERFSSPGLASLVSFNSMIWPLSYTRVSSWLNRSRLRMMVSPSASPSSLNSSTYFTDRQWAMCRVSPSPKKPLSMPLHANRPTWPLCNGVTGRPVTPLHKGHVGLLACSGMLNGFFGEGETRHIAHWRSVKYVDEFNEEGEAEGETIIRKRERFSHELTLAYESGQIIELKETKEEVLSKSSHE